MNYAKQLGYIPPHTIPGHLAMLSDSPAVAMPNGQPAPSAAIVAEAQAALGFVLNTSTIEAALGLANLIPALSPAWTQADVDGVYGARTQQMLAAYQAAANNVGSPLTYGPVNASDGSLTTGGSVGETSLSTLDSLRYFVRSNGSTSYWGQTIQAPQFLTSNQSPLPAPLVPVTPGAPSATTTTTSTPMSTGAKVAIGVGVVAALALAGWGVHHAMSAQQGASSATAKTKAAPRARRVRR
jgi:peptidoglycan hydrolase-like protein with peptidoglycan-binding domain